MTLKQTVWTMDQSQGMAPMMIASFKKHKGSQLNCWVAALPGLLGEVKIL